ncbi:class I SAM-dependent methyltransferase [Porphyromonas pogonae]|uniref:class I SAM-dependent methyltransferase n=1 Tax=Porphyromonas pogonae TaxID=867595 RepID=UPI002E78428E|nr:hypothetical protein [Porphyromonas pogonae]
MNKGELINYWVEKYKDIGADRILLGANDIPSDLRSLVATQISLKSNFMVKLPSWYSNPSIYIPTKLALEQSTGEVCARYKQRFISDTDILCDFTGGFGVDFWAMATKAHKSYYIEQDKDLYEAARDNLTSLLGNDKMIEFIHGNSTSYLDYCADHDVSFIFMDPARRDTGDKNRRVFAIDDCYPNAVEIIRDINKIYSLKRKIPPKILVKLSPMLDVAHTLKTLPQAKELNILCHKNEVKEILVYIDLEHTYQDFKHIPVIASNILKDDTDLIDIFTSTLNEEGGCKADYVEEIGQYVYEPNAGIMKSGMFKSLGLAFNILQVSNDSHLYSSDRFIPDFPGRKFEVEEILPFKSSLLKDLKSKKIKAQITCRNFPLSPDELRKKTGIKDDSSRTIIGTKMSDGTLFLLNCISLYTR